MSVLLRLEGLSPYRPALALQDALVSARAAGVIPDTVLLLTHPETITLGRRAGDGAVVHAGEVDVVPIARGGEATWHGPGQLVAYPVVQLRGAHRDVHGALRALEQAVIDVLATWGVAAGRDARNTGVWIDGRKVCSIGIGLHKWVVRHGIALNVDADLAGFARIRPCGFDADVMTRLADHVEPCPALDDLALPLGRAIADGLGAPAASVLVDRCDTDADAARLVGRLRAVAAGQDPP